VKVRFGIREKILVFFLALSLTSLGVISFVAVRSMGEMGYIVKQNSISMGETVVNTSIAALEDLGRRLLQQKAVDVAKEIELFFERHPDLEVSECKGNEELRVIAIQRVGRTGYTMVYDRSYTVYFSANPNLVGANLHRVAGEPAHYWSILERSVVGEASGYYDWEDEEGNVRSKYMYCVPVEGTELVVAATTYIDEFSAPAEGTKSKIASAVSATTKYIDEQMDKAQLTFIVVILGMIVIVSGLGYLLARTITGPILELTKGAEVIGKGELGYSIKTNTGDEIQQLAEQFNTMASTLKESYTNLEQKVEERTKRERQRAEQLRTLMRLAARSALS